MYAIICGGREYAFDTSDVKWLDKLHAEFGFEEVITGGAHGADAEAEDWARQVGINVTVMPANWEGQGKSAGPRRNARMLRYLLAIPKMLPAEAPCELAVIAFPGGRGTANMRRQAALAGVHIIDREEG